jgi:hypothetical protein
MQTARLSERTAFLGQVDVVPQGGDRRVTAWGLDVSETGMFLQTPQLMAVGDALSLRFTVEDTEVHVRAAEVVRQRPLEAVNVDGRVAGMAIRFVSIDPASRTALRRLVQRGSAAGGVVATVDSVLPAPTSTLPPLTRSIIETVVGRDLDDTQDLLPPATTRRAAGGAVTLSMLPFTSLDVSLPPDEPNLSAESRVFGGVPDAPRAVTMGPRPRSRPPTTAPLGSVSMPPRAERSVQVTQPMFTLPPIDVVEGLAPSLLPESTGTASTTSSSTTSSSTTSTSTTSTSAQHDAVDDVSANNPFNNWRFAPWASGAPAPRANDAVAVDTAVAVAAVAAVDAVVQRAMHVRFDDERPVIDNPSVLESVTVPPAALGEDSGSYSLGDLPGSSSTPPTLGAQASSRGLDEGLAIRHLPLARERQASRAGGHQPRRSWGMATAVLLAGCAAGAVVGLMQGADRRHASGEPPPSMIAATVAIGHPEPATTVPATTVPTATVPATTVPTATEPTATESAATEPTPRSVAQAEQELREPIAAATAAPAPTAPPGEVVEARAAATAPPAVKVAVEAKATAATATKVALMERQPANKATRVDVDAQPAARNAEPVLTSTRATAALRKPGRVEVPLPVGGRILKVFALGAPARVVVDLAGATLPGEPLNVGQGGAEQVRFGRPDPGTQRVVVVLSGDHKPDAVDARLKGDSLIATWQF